MHCVSPPPLIEADEMEENIFLNSEFSDSDGDIYDSSEDDIPQDSKLTFKGHSDVVSCCALDNTMQYAVSGGKDGTGFMWNFRTGEIIMECTGHADSVISIGFNHNSTLIATGDKSGYVQVWDVQTGASLCDFEASKLSWLKWHDSQNSLLAGSVSGHCWMWDVPDGNMKSFRTFRSENNCGRIMPDGLRSVVGYNDGTVQIFDLKKSSAIHAVGPLYNSSSVLTIDCHQDNVLVLTGCTDGLAKLITSNDGKTPHRTWSTHPSVTSEGRRPSQVHPYAATGASKYLTIWDIPTQVQRQQCKIKSKIIKLICDPVTPLVFTASYDGMVRLYDGRTGQLEKKWGGHNKGILDFTLSRDGGTLLTASKDKTCKIFKVAQS